MSQVLAYPVPTKGLNTKEEPNAFSGAFSPFIKNAYVSQTSIRKRRGISQVGSRALPLPGTGMDLISYVDAVGGRHELALTTTSAFKYNGTNKSWDDITPGNLLSDGATGWISGAGTVTSASVAAASLPGSPPAGAAIFLDCVADVTDANILAHLVINPAVDLSAYTEIRLWVYSVATGLSIGSLEILITENNDGTKGGTQVIAANTVAIAADTWTRVTFTVDLSSIDGAQSIAIYSDHATEFDGLDLYIDEFTAVTPFAGSVNIPITSALATDTTEFSNNGGTALCMCNGVDDYSSFD